MQEIILWGELVKTLMWCFACAVLHVTRVPPVRVLLPSGSLPPSDRAFTKQQVCRYSS